MSSTPDRSRGQALAFFAVAFSAVLAAVALAFDAGAMIVERRDQQNAADAAAIGAARYVVTDPSKAISTARDLASANGFTDANASQRVSVNIPPTSGPFQGRPYYIEVEIRSTRPSIWAAITGVADWPVSARAVATNQDTVNAEWSTIALHPTACDAVLISGNGSITAYADIQVNSSCTGGALRRQGGGSIIVDIPGGACNVVGNIKEGGGTGQLNCVKNEGAPLVPDPLAAVPEPPLPLPAPAVQRVSGTLSVPSGCPGAVLPASLSNPLECSFPSSYAGTSWRIFPGLYPGGIKLQGGTFYMEPGIYYLGGGGFVATGTGTVLRSVAPGGTTGPAGGVMIYNSQVVGSAIQPVTLNGSQADIQLLPLKDGSIYENLLFWQDRAYDINGDDLTINGGSSDMAARGLLYVPSGDVKVNGGSGQLQIDTTIANTFVVHGSNGSQIRILDEDQYRFVLIAAGLVE